MDLCLLSPKVLPEGELLDPPVLNVALIREQIYREYFLNHLKRKKDPSY